MSQTLTLASYSRELIPAVTVTDEVASLVVRRSDGNMARIAATVVAGILIAIVSYAIDPTFGLFVVGLIIMCLIAYGGFRLWRVLKNYAHVQFAARGSRYPSEGTSGLLLLGLAT